MESMVSLHLFIYFFVGGSVNIHSFLRAFVVSFVPSFLPSSFVLVVVDFS